MLQEKERPVAAGTADRPEIIDAQDSADIAAALRDYQARWIEQRLDTSKRIGLLLADIVFAVRPR